MSSWNIDPATGDYVMVKGAPDPTDSLVVPAYYRLKVRRGGWLYAPDDDYGSDFYLLKKRTPDPRARITLAEKALQPIIDDGRASEVDITVIDGVNNRHNEALDIKITDAQGQPQTTQLTPVGG